jgi:CBS domain-containing protein
MEQAILETSIGKLIVGEHPVIFHPYTPLSMIIEAMQEQKKGAIVIVEDRKVTGIITERDLLMKVLRKQSNLSQILAKDVMVKNPRTILESDSLKRAILYMRIGGFRHLIVLNSANECVSILSVKDIINFLSDSLELKAD